MHGHPVSVFISTLVGHLLALGLMVAAVAVWQNRISVFLIFLPVYMFVTGLFAVGLGWIAASLNVFLRDTAQVVSVVLTSWLYLTPIFIPEDKYPVWAHWVLIGNPLYYLVRAYRTVLLTSGMPDLGDLAIAAAYGAAAFVVGGLFFRHMKRGFADVL
jgi:lipopolysaccharide transport system permease protein